MSYIGGISISGDEADLSEVRETATARGWRLQETAAGQLVFVRSGETADELLEECARLKNLVPGTVEGQGIQKLWSGEDEQRLLESLRGADLPTAPRGYRTDLTPVLSTGSATKPTTEPAKKSSEEPADGSTRDQSTRVPGLVHRKQVLTSTRTAPAEFALADHLWQCLPELKQAELATQYFQALVASQKLLDEGRVLNVAPELVLLKDVGEEDKKEMRVSILAARSNVYAPADAKVLRERAEKETELLGEAVTSRRKWSGLADKAPRFLVATLLSSFLMGGAGMWLVYEDRADLLDVVALLFVLAVITISPAVLLLLERPLANLENWTPGGLLKQDEMKSEAGAEKKDGGDKNDKKGEGGKKSAEPQNADAGKATV